MVGKLDPSAEVILSKCEGQRDAKLEDVELHVINEKVKQSPPLPKEEVLAAEENESVEEHHRNVNGQNQFYQQQTVAGLPVYVQGVRPSPVNVSRLPMYRVRDGNEGGDRGGGGSSPSIFNVSFEESVIRNRFVQKVYSILTAQLTFTCGFIALCIFEPNVKRFVTVEPIPLIMAFTAQLVIYFTLVCCVAARRNFPLNFILLTIFTFAFAYIMAFISSYYSTYIVITSMSITAGICFVVSIFACQTSWDITAWGAYLCIIGVVAVTFGFAALLIMILTGNKIAFLIYAGLIALVFSLYLMYDTQMILGGRRIELSPEEYIFGALTLYVDIMEIFWAVLTLFGSWKS